MKIGILTYHYADNYGAVWQTYALQTYLERMGHTVEVVDYRPRMSVRGGIVGLPMSADSIRADIYGLYTAYRYHRGRLRSAIHGNTFEEFRTQHLKVSSGRFETYTSLFEIARQYDALVCGSDQIWNTSPHAGLDPAYFAMFGGSETLRVSYAASFGKASVDPRFHKKYAQYLGQMDAISVREKSGAALVKELCDRRAVWLMDPALLLNDYSALYENREKTEYASIFAYALRQTDAVETAARQIAEQTGGTVVYAHRANLSPSQWLNGIRNADVVVTNSFHGTAFSVVFQKNFAVIGFGGGKAEYNERILSLLGRLGIEDRFFEKHGDVTLSRIEEIPVDWQRVARRLEEWHREAAAYLSKELSRAKKMYLWSGDKRRCCGCEACRTVCPEGCIQMEEDSEGFLYPARDASRCTECGLCNEVCPWESENSADPGLTPKAYAAWNRDEEVVVLSTSGGIFSALAQKTIDDGGAVFGAAFLPDCASVRHIEVAALSEIDALRGSKYVQSRMNDSFAQVYAAVKSGRKVLFIGTPCQVHAIKRYIMVLDRQRENENLVTCDLACHGVPSPGLFQKYLGEIESRYDSKVVSYSFRDKSRGWYFPCVSILFSNGKRIRVPNWADEFMHGFLKNVYLRPSCYSCKYARFPRVGDITLADWWGILEHYPQYYLREGTSLVIVNSDRGMRFLDACSLMVSKEECDLETAVRCNTHLRKPADISVHHSDFLQRNGAGTFMGASKVYMGKSEVAARVGKRMLKMILYAVKAGGSGKNR